MLQFCLLMTAIAAAVAEVQPEVDEVGKSMFAQLQLYVDHTGTAEQGEKCAAALDDLARMLRNGADPDAYRKNDSTMLMYASWNGARDAVRLLLKHGAQPNLRDEDGETALMAAASMGWGKIAIELLAKGADLLAKNKRGQDAFAMAREGGYAKVVTVLEEARASGVGELLLKCKADLDIS